MKSTCDLVAERVALGEALDEVADHAASCDHCKQLVAVSVALAEDRRAADPGVGFSARITAGARRRIAVRRRRRIGSGAAAMVAVAGVLIVVVLRSPDPEPIAGVSPRPATQPVSRPDIPPMTHERWVDPDVRALVHLANVERSSHISARWSRIEKPLAPYRAVLKGSEP